MKPEVYFDTSALAKWYLNEALSEEVEKFLLEHGPVAISDLTRIEMRSLLALLALLSEQPLRALDALHLVIALEIGADRLATSDRVMAASARALGMTVVKFLHLASPARSADSTATRRPKHPHRPGGGRVGRTG